MANENFTTYTEVDEHGNITVTSSKVEWVDMNNDSTSYVYKDFGINYFGDVSHDTEFCAVLADPSGKSVFYAIGNQIADYDEYSDNLYPAVLVFMAKPSVNYEFFLKNMSSGNYDRGAVSQNTLYYCTVARSGTTATVNIYTDSARTNLHDTLTITCTSTAFRYLYACMGNDEAQPQYPTSGYSQNFDLEPSAATGAAIYFYNGTNNIELQRDDGSPVQMFNGTDIIGLKLGAINDANASPFHIFDGVTIKAILKMP